jgi:hypothetical protein
MAARRSLLFRKTQLVQIEIEIRPFVHQLWLLAICGPGLEAGLAIYDDMRAGVSICTEQRAVLLAFLTCPTRRSLRILSRGLLITCWAALFGSMDDQIMRQYGVLIN